MVTTSERSTLMVIFKIKINSGVAFDLAVGVFTPEIFKRSPRILVMESNFLKIMFISSY